MSLNPADAAREVEERREEWLGIVADLIRIPSEAPPGDTTEIAGYFRDLLAERGVPHETIAPREEMPNVAASFEGGAGEGPHLAFNGHFDTFHRGEEDKWDRDPFSGAVEDGRVHGRGATDMHGGFTASLAAFLYLWENRESVPGRVTFAAVSDEESGGEWGTEYLLSEHPEYRGDALISGEPSTPGLLRFATRGVLWLRIAARGESAHSAYPDGTNAIDAAVDVARGIDDALPGLVSVPEDLRARIEAGREEADAVLGEGATDHVLSAQANLNRIEGGSKINVTPETAEAQVDVRLPLETRGEEVIALAREIAADSPAEVEVEVLTHTDPTYTDPEHPLLGAMYDAVSEVRGEAPAWSCGLGYTDARFYRLHGVACAVYGPTPHNMGSQNEYMEVGEFVDVARAHAAGAVRYLTGGG